MKVIQHDRIYKTSDEIAFIRDLCRGIHSDSLESRIRLLIGYNKSIEQRDNWENLDQAAIMEFLDKEIEAEARA